MFGRIAGVLISGLILLDYVLGEEIEIAGCGGFVQSPHPLDFNQIEIKLYTSTGNLKLKTECAPTTGYYFMPLDTKGEYVMKIIPPEGWTFEPSEYNISFDGVSSDKCAEGADLNFVFKGFLVYGKVDTHGYSEGPVDALLTLSGENGFFVKTRSKAGGHFSFESVPPGRFTIRSSQTGVTYEKDTFSFEVKENMELENKIVVSGYEIKGKVTSHKSGVEGVTLVLLSEKETKNIQNCQPGKPATELAVPKDGPSHIVCHQKSDQSGIFRFKNVTPGKYVIIPVYKGKNIVYNVSPDRIDIDLKHQPVELGGFEVDGFTVLGKVKSLKGSVATILVDGKVRATSGQDGSFSIPKMKQGTYEFEVMADKFRFEKQKIKVTVSNPILPDFEPSKFLLCGTVKLVRDVPTHSSLSLNFEKVGEKKSQQEKVSSTDSSPLCYFLPAGKYSVRVESEPKKFFVPETQVVEVPSQAGFAFIEFSGFISGKISCPLLRDSECDATIQLFSKSTGGILSEVETIGGTFKFSQLESGEYDLRVSGTSYCWKEEIISAELRNSNVDNIQFIQTGFSVSLTSSHSTKVIISSKQKSTKILEVQLKSMETKGICLKEYSNLGYEIDTISCHTFNNVPYSFNLERNVVANVELVAITHEFSGTVQTNAPLTGLQMKRNEQLMETGGSLPLKEEKKGVYIYEVKLVAKPGESVSLHLFSYDFIFEPNSINFIAAEDCQKDVFRITAQKSHVIKGKFQPPLEGIEVRIDLVGEPDASMKVKTNSNGEYIAGPFIHSQGFQVTPSLPGYTFKPFGDGYSFNALQWAKILVSVEDSLNETPVTSVLLSLSGPNGYRQNKMTDSNGEITFGDLHPGTYFLKALLKEFLFEPSALHIELEEQESKEVKLKAKRESFSMFGKLFSLSGDVMPNLMVAAKGLGNCSEYGEEGISDENGNFRIWSLRSYCTYHVSVVRKDEYALRVERTIPQKLEVKIGNENVENVTFVVIQPVKRMDISLRSMTKNVRDLESLRAIIYSAKTPDTPLFSAPFNGVPYIILPPIPKDGGNYFIMFECSLSRSNFEYVLPAQINFTANEAYAHFSFDFSVEHIQHEQEIGKSSYLAFTFIIVVFLIILNFEKLSGYLKDGIDKYLQRTSGSASSKRKLKTKSQ